MTYDASEKSRYTGQPVECYRFTQGGNIWRVTSADRDITLPVGVFEPLAVTRGEFDFSQEDSGETLEITVPRDHPVAALFIADKKAGTKAAAVMVSKKKTKMKKPDFIKGVKKLFRIK